MSNVSYYDALATEYSLFFRDLAANMEEEGTWLDALLRDRSAGRVLDACCGTGRQTIPLLRRGYRVSSADPCASMLREARGAAEASGVTAELIRAAFVDLPDIVREPFDAVIALGNGLCHQEHLSDIFRSLEALRHCCRMDGLCLVGIKDFDAIRAGRPYFHGPRVRHEADRCTILYQTWEYADPLLLCTAFVLRRTELGWTARSAQTREYMLGGAELTRLARRAGFNTVERLHHPYEATYALS